MHNLMNTYSNIDLYPIRGEGVRVFDRNGASYLDMISGVGVNALGHAHPKLIPILQKQLETMVHCSNLYHVGEQELLASRLAEISGASKVFFCNSGCEANEAAIKLARLYAHKRGIHNPKIIVTHGAFHGRTLATVAATASPKVRAGFDPLPEGFVRVPYNDLAALQGIMDPDCIALLIEPVQGEGGVNLPSLDYLREVRALCDSRQWLLMFDEVQTGIARTGRWFAHQHVGIEPDVMTLAKGLGSGIPIGACLAWGEAANTFTPGTHGSTFGGNPLACRAGIETLRIIEEDRLADNARAVGGYILDLLHDELGGLPQVQQIRGLGLMVGITLDRPCAPLVEQCLSEGLLANVTAERVIRLLPPLILSREDAHEAISILSRLVRDFVRVV